MKKLNISFINGSNKEDAILKIKDDSFSITTRDNSIIKIPYSDIKDYEYSDNEKLTIKRKHNSDIIVEVDFDITLINTLKEIVKNSNSYEQQVDFKTNDSIQAKKEEAILNDTNFQERTKNTNEISYNTNVSQTNIANDIPVKAIVGTLVSVIIFIVILYTVFTPDKTIDGGSDAVFYALREIPESVLTFDDVMSNELKCEAKEKTDDEIILVQCTTTNQDVIDHYDSETIWYGYQETADGRSHYRSINKSKDTVLKNMRKN